MGATLKQFDMWCDVVAGLVAQWPQTLLFFPKKRAMFTETMLMFTETNLLYDLLYDILYYIFCI